MLIIDSLLFIKPADICDGLEWRVLKVGRKWSAQLCACRATAAATVFVDEAVGGAAAGRGRGPAGAPRQFRDHRRANATPHARHVAPTLAAALVIRAVFCAIS